MLNKTSIATILGAAAVGIIKKRMGSSIRLKTSPYILVIPGEGMEWTIEDIPAEIIEQPINGSLDDKLERVFENNSPEIPDEYKHLIQKIHYAYYDELTQLRNGSYTYVITASPRIHFKPNIFTDWLTSVHTRRKLNEMFNPTGINFVKFLIRTNETFFDDALQRELGYMIDSTEEYYRQFPNEYDDSDYLWENEDWVNRFENWGDGAISVYDESAIIDADTGEIYNPTKKSSTNLRVR